MTQDLKDWIFISKVSNHSFTYNKHAKLRLLNVDFPKNFTNIINFCLCLCLNLKIRINLVNQA